NEPSAVLARGARLSHHAAAAGDVVREANSEWRVANRRICYAHYSLFATRYSPFDPPHDPTRRSRAHRGGAPAHQPDAAGGRRRRGGAGRLFGQLDDRPAQAAGVFGIRLTQLCAHHSAESIRTVGWAKAA